MKKHFIADVLSILEIVCGVIICGLLYTKAHSGHVFLLFCAGQLFDAFDGIAARRWPYPQDGKNRWWRNHIEIIEYLKDIFLALSALIFITLKVDFATGIILIVFSTLIGTACQIKITRSTPEIGAKIAIKRRNYGYLPALATVLLLLLWESPWPVFVKAGTAMSASMTGVYLWYKKEDRRTEHHTR